MIEDLILYEGVYLTKNEYLAIELERVEKFNQFVKNVKSTQDSITHIVDAIRMSFESIKDTSKSAKNASESFTNFVDTLKKTDVFYDDCVGLDFNVDLARDWENFKESQKGTDTMIDEINKNKSK